MSRPHKCPTCDGTKKRDGADCPTCEAEGVVWEPAGAEESAVSPAAADPKDLTYRT